MGMRTRIDTWGITLAILLIIIGIVLAVKAIQATTPYYIEYFNNLACTYKALMGNFKTYTTCSINALHIIWNALEATPEILAQGLGW